MAKELSPVKQKILLLLFAGLAFGSAYTPKHQSKIITGVQKEWKRLNDKKVNAQIRALYRSKLLDLKEHSDGTFTMTLTGKGKMQVLHYRFAGLTIQKQKWDGKWRVVVFDIPEEQRKARDALRWKLKGLGFCELQKSVFVFPYECHNEIDFVIEFFDVRPFVRYGVLESIDNDLNLRKIFRLL
jgi:DNA-binding transcriptional regulator PaaX